MSGACAPPPHLRPRAPDFYARFAPAAHPQTASPHFVTAIEGCLVSSASHYWRRLRVGACAARPCCSLRTVSASLAPPTLSPRSMITSCGGPFTWESLTLTPDPPVGGQTALLAGVNGVSTTAVSGGAGELYAELDGVLVYTSPPITTCGNSVSFGGGARREGAARWAHAGGGGVVGWGGGGGADRPRENPLRASELHSNRAASPHPHPPPRRLTPIMKERDAPAWLWRPRNRVPVVEWRREHVRRGDAARRGHAR